MAELRPPAASVVDEVDDADDPDRYEQVIEHARGGLGRVVRAIDKRLGRTVAVKELLRRNTSNEARFMREALITARLEHPGIVPVHEAGRWPNGDPYYVMKLVEGRTLKELIAEHSTMRDRLTLLHHVIAVADAVGYAHSEGVIHRDLKPSNVVVGNFGETMVVDWGLARDRKRTDLPELDCPDDGMESGSDETARVSTVSGKVVGTPGYMSPEQARGELVDERGDVYAIGAVLYELLAGVAPHQDTTPQLTLERVLAGPPVALAAAVPGVPGELGTIVAKAMARDPDERYPNGKAIAEDLRRFSTGKLVSAHSYSTWALLRKKIAQYRGVVAVAAASAIALSAVGVMSFRRVVHEKNVAQHERERTEDALSQAEKRKHELVLLQAVTSLRKDPTATIAWLKTYGITDDDRGPIVNLIDEAMAMGVARYVFRPGDWAMDAAFTPDNTSIVAAVRDGVLRKYDLRTGQLTQLGTAPSAPEVLAITPDGSAVITAGTTGEVVSWPLAGGTPTTLVPSSGRMAISLRFSPDGKRVLVDRGKGSLDVVSVTLDGTGLAPVGNHDALRTIVADGDWSKQVIVTSPTALSAYENNVARPLLTTTKAIQFVGMSPRGDLVLVYDGVSVLAVPFGGGPSRVLTPYGDQVLSFAWSPDEKQVVIVGHEHDIVLVDIASGTTRRMRGHTDALYTVAWSPDGKRLLSASDDSTARVWTVADGSSVVLRGHDDDIYRARWSPDGRLVSTASFDGSVRVWPVDQAGAMVLTEGEMIDDMVVVGNKVGVKTPTSAAWWDLSTGKREEWFSWGNDPKTVGVPVGTPDGKYQVASSPDWSLVLRRHEQPTLHLVGHTAQITRMAFSSDGAALYTSSLDGTLRRWDTATGASTTVIAGKDPVRGIAVAHDGRVVAQVSDDLVMIAPDGTKTVLGSGAKWCIFDAEFDRVKDRLQISRCDLSVALVEGSKVTELAGGYNFARLAVSNDGSRIAGAMADRTVRIWDAATGKQQLVLRGHQDLVMDVAFSPDDKMLASGSYDRTIRVWELSTQRSRVIRGHGGAIDRVAWKDRSHLVTGSRDGTIRLWNVPSLELPSIADLTARLSSATTARIDLDRPTTPDGSGGAS
ncbi:MAG TPA: protein kinase [Kofleriaceae bacterium]